MSSITDLLSKILQNDEARKIIPSLTGILGNGSNNFTDSCKQIFGLFNSCDDLVATLEVAWDRTKGGNGVEVSTGANVGALLRIVSDSANWVDGIQMCKQTMSKADAMGVIRTMWASFGLADVESVVEPLPEIIVEPEIIVDPVVQPVEIPGSQLGNAQGTRCFTNQAEAKAFATEVLAAQTRAGHKPCPTYPKSFWVRVGAYSGGYQVAYGLNTWVASVKIGPCATTSTSSTSTCSTGSCGSSQPVSTCSTGTCSSSKPVSTCSTGKCPGTSKKK